MHAQTLSARIFSAQTFSAQTFSARILSGLGSIGALVILLSLPAHAAVDSRLFNFTGRLTSLSDPSQVTGYDPTKLENSLFSGQYAFDPSTPNLVVNNPNSANFLVRSTVDGQGFSLKIGNETVTIPTGEGGTFYRQFLNNGLGAQSGDTYTVENTYNSPDGQDKYRVFLTLRDNTSQAWDSVGPDADPVSIEPWNIRSFQISTPRFSAEGLLTGIGPASIEPPPTKIPESSIVLGLAIVAGGLYRIQRREK